MKAAIRIMLRDLSFNKADPLRPISRLELLQRSRDCCNPSCLPKSENSEAIKRNYERNDNAEFTVSQEPSYPAKKNEYCERDEEISRVNSIPVKGIDDSAEHEV